MSATSLVVLHTPGRVVIGADTLDLHTHPYEKIYRCKLHEVKTDSLGTVIFALAGLRDDGAAGEIFDSVQIAEQAISSAQTLNQAVSNFEALALPKYITTLTRIRDFDSDTYATYVHGEGHDAARMIFANVSNGAPAWIILRFSIMPGSDTGLVRLSARKDGCPGDFCYPQGLLGVKDLGDGRMVGEAMGILSPSLRYDTDHVDIVRKLIELEIKGSPEIVGGRANIIVLDVDGVHWVQSF